MAETSAGSPRAMAADDDAGGKQGKSDDGQEKNDVARIKDALGEILKMGHDAEGGDGIDQPGDVPARQQICHGREAAQDEQEADDEGKNEADDLVARHGGGHAADGQIGAGHEETA